MSDLSKLQPLGAQAKTVTIAFRQSFERKQDAPASLIFLSQGLGIG